MAAMGRKRTISYGNHGENMGKWWELENFHGISWWLFWGLSGISPTIWWMFMWFNHQRWRNIGLPQLGHFTGHPLNESIDVPLWHGCWAKQSWPKMYDDTKIEDLKQNVWFGGSHKWGYPKIDVFFPGKSDHKMEKITGGTPMTKRKPPFLSDWFISFRLGVMMNYCSIRASPWWTRNCW